MRDVNISIGKFRRLLEYTRAIGLEPEVIASAVGLNYGEVMAVDDSYTVPSIYYSLLYGESVKQMQTLGTTVPWAAGIGGDAFRLMCYCMISARALGEALRRAEEFERLAFPLTGHRIKLQVEGDEAVLHYIIDNDKVDSVFAPKDWDRTSYMATVTKASGLEVWYGLCGWLIAQSIELQAVNIAAPYVTEAYERRSQAVFHCPVTFEADENTLRFPASYLDYPLVHNTESLEEFLETGPFQLWSLDNKPASTSAAIRSLLGNDFRKGLPSFESMANSMHMSESTLRRHLQKENTSYQQIKDECRRSVAIELLCISGMKSAEVGERLGFTDTSSFVRSFRNWTGMTPKAFKQQNSQFTGASATHNGG